ncbi:uncharacterized protein LOC135929633 isoform X1 [Gordionus sp. m RMFG-2023]|uniref:uncharacterized protein LOC135929633 isoform X1 n=1 Tax=Gordionus sp. m RMFG-2023 TaxID=3053472 RepID=UPI0031FBC9B0
MYLTCLSRSFFIRLISFFFLLFVVLFCIVLAQLIKNSRVKVDPDKKKNQFAAESYFYNNTTLPFTSNYRLNKNLAIPRYETLFDNTFDGLDEDGKLKGFHINETFSSENFLSKIPRNNFRTQRNKCSRFQTHPYLIHFGLNQPLTCPAFRESDKGDTAQLPLITLSELYTNKANYSSDAATVPPPYTMAESTSSTSTFSPMLIHVSTPISSISSDAPIILEVGTTILSQETDDVSHLHPEDLRFYRLPVTEIPPFDEWKQRLFRVQREKKRNNDNNISRNNGMAKGVNSNNNNRIEENGKNLHTDDSNSEINNKVNNEEGYQLLNDKVNLYNINDPLFSSPLTPLPPYDPSIDAHQTASVDILNPIPNNLHTHISPQTNLRSDNVSSAGSLIEKEVEGGGVDDDKNYASAACGAKILHRNSEAINPGGVLQGNLDDYMLNPCSARVWFTFELCEPVQIKKIEIANLELFSSSPKEFRVHISDRYPTKEWLMNKTFVASDERKMQSFRVDANLFARYIKIELLSHHGSEHYCPLTLIRVYGTNLAEEFVPEDEDDENVDSNYRDDVISEARAAFRGDVHDTTTAPLNDNIITTASSDRYIIANYVTLEHSDNNFNEINNSYINNNLSNVTNLQKMGNLTENCKGMHSLNNIEKNFIYTKESKNMSLKESQVNSMGDRKLEDLTKDSNPPNSQRDSREGTADNSSDKQSRNILLSAKDAVLTILNHASNVLVPTDIMNSQHNHRTHANHTSLDLLNSGSHDITLNDTTDDLSYLQDSLRIHDRDYSSFLNPPVLNYNVTGIFPDFDPLHINSFHHANLLWFSQFCECCSSIGFITSFTPIYTLAGLPHSASCFYARLWMMIYPNRSQDCLSCLPLIFSSSSKDFSTKVKPAQIVADVTGTDIEESNIKVKLNFTDTYSENTTVKSVESFTANSIKPETGLKKTAISALSHKESIFMRLNNRIRALESNVSLAGRYLEELSRSYARHIEQTGVAFDKIARVIDATAILAKRRHTTTEERARDLARRLNETVQNLELYHTAQATSLNQNHSSLIILHLIFLILELSLLSIVIFYILPRRATTLLRQYQLSVEINKNHTLGSNQQFTDNTRKAVFSEELKPHTLIRFPFSRSTFNTLESNSSSPNGDSSTVKDIYLDSLDTSRDVGENSFRYKYSRNKDNDINHANSLPFQPLYSQPKLEQKKKKKRKKSNKASDYNSLMAHKILILTRDFNLESFSTRNKDSNSVRWNNPNYPWSNIGVEKGSIYNLPEKPYIKLENGKPRSKFNNDNIKNNCNHDKNSHMSSTCNGDVGKTTTDNSSKNEGFYYSLFDNAKFFKKGPIKLP